MNVFDHDGGRGVKISDRLTIRHLELQKQKSTKNLIQQKHSFMKRPLASTAHLCSFAGGVHLGQSYDFEFKLTDCRACFLRA